MHSGKILKALHSVYLDGTKQTAGTSKCDRLAYEKNSTNAMNIVSFHRSLFGGLYSPNQTKDKVICCI